MNNIILDKDKKIISIGNNNFNLDNKKELKTFLFENFLTSIKFDITQGTTILFFSDDDTKSSCEIVFNGIKYFINVFYCEENKIKFDISIFIGGNAHYIFDINYYDDNNINSYVINYTDGFIDCEVSGLASCEIFPNVLGLIKNCILEYIMYKN